MSRKVKNIAIVEEKIIKKIFLLRNETLVSQFVIPYKKFLGGATAFAFTNGAAYHVKVTKMSVDNTLNVFWHMRSAYRANLLLALPPLYEDKNNKTRQG